MLVAHKRGDVIVRLSADKGSYQGDAYGTDTEEKPLDQDGYSRPPSDCSIR